MDCMTARILAELPGNRAPNASELPVEDAADLGQHLQSCSECRCFIELERKLDAPIARAMQAVPVPPGLKSRILDQLATQRGALHRRRFFYAAAAAACVVAAVGLLTWKPQNQVRFDINQFVINADRYVEDPKPEVDAWLTAQGIQYQPPIAFDPRFLASHGMQTVQGKQVPMLYYRNAERNVFAKVYVLRGDDFDLTGLPKTYSGSSGYGHVEILPDPAQPTKLAYVIVFTGDSLDPFKLPPSQST
jgi:Protein of unknown function (DUF3379)